MQLNVWLMYSGLVPSSRCEPIRDNHTPCSQRDTWYYWGGDRRCGQWFHHRHHHRHLGCFHCITQQEERFLKASIVANWLIFYTHIIHTRYVHSCINPLNVHSCIIPLNAEGIFIYMIFYFDIVFASTVQLRYGEQTVSVCCGNNKKTSTAVHGFNRVICTSLLNHSQLIIGQRLS